MPRRAGRRLKLPDLICAQRINGMISIGKKCPTFDPQMLLVHTRKALCFFPQLWTMADHSTQLHFFNHILTQFNILCIDADVWVCRRMEDHIDWMQTHAWNSSGPTSHLSRLTHLTITSSIVSVPGGADLISVHRSFIRHAPKLETCIVHWGSAKDYRRFPEYECTQLFMICAFECIRDILHALQAVPTCTSLTTSICWFIEPPTIAIVACLIKQTHVLRWKLCNASIDTNQVRVLQRAIYPCHLIFEGFMRGNGHTPSVLMCKE